MFQSQTTRYWAKLGGCGLVFAAAGITRAQIVPSLPSTQRQALALMTDIVPPRPVTGTPIRVSYAADHAFWGTLFGDKQVAALVAVDSIQSKDHDPGGDANLCLLLWERGWKFHQRVGKVTATVDYEQHWGWAIKHREPLGAWYVVSRLDLYPSGEHLSWLCDAKTHTLVPTNWPRDAIPSISGDTITFTRQDKPGYSPTIHNIYRFTNQPVERIASCNDVAVTHQEGEVITLWEGRSHQACTWQVRELIPCKRYALCRTAGEQAAQPFREDAVAEFDWGDQGDTHNATAFLWRRLSGLSENALRGDWDQDGKSNPEPPRSVTITGLPEAIQRFSWPADGGSHH